MSGYESSGDFNFFYTNANGITMEDFFVLVARMLRGKHWNMEQKADLVVLGCTKEGRQYVLNQPSDEAMRSLSIELGTGDLKMVAADEINFSRVIMRNMVTTGRDSVFIEASVRDVNPETGYRRLVPSYMSMSTMELYASMKELVALKMLDVSESPELEWLYGRYENNSAEA